MENLRLWDKQSNINVMGNVMTPTEVRSSYPVQTDGECVLQYISQNIVGGIDNLITLANVHNVNMDNKTPQQILDEIIYKMGNPPEPEPTAEDRIAAAMEYKNLMSM